MYKRIEMRLQKCYGQFSLIFQIIEKANLKDEDLLEDLMISFEDALIINKNQEFKELSKEQSKNLKHILVPFDNEVFIEIDTILVLNKLVMNFLEVTEQNKNFMLYKTEGRFDNSKFITESNEYYLGSLNNISFSPLARQHWRKPSKMLSLFK